MSYLKTIRGQQLGYDFDIITNLYDHEAVAALEYIGTDFAQSLYLASQEYKLSPKQIFWCHCLALESQGVKVR